jgi:hypothetical protein
VAYTHLSYVGHHNVGRNTCEICIQILSVSFSASWLDFVNKMCVLFERSAVVVAIIWLLGSLLFIIIEVVTSHN